MLDPWLGWMLAEMMVQHLGDWLDWMLGCLLGMQMALHWGCQFQVLVMQWGSMLVLLMEL